MRRYFYSDLDIPICENMLAPYYKQTKYGQIKVKLKSKHDYIFMNCEPSEMPFYIRRNYATSKYKIRISKGENNTNIEIESVPDVRGVVNSIFFKFAALCFGLPGILLCSCLNFFGLVYMLNAFMIVKTLITNKRFKKNVYIEVTNFLKDKLDAYE